MESIKHLLLILTIMLTSCQKRIISNSCPEIPIYSKEFQNNLNNDLEIVNSYFINQVVLDYGNLREQVRVCNGE